MASQKLFQGVPNTKDAQDERAQNMVTLCTRLREMDEPVY